MGANVWPEVLGKALTRFRAAVEPAFGAPRTSGARVLNSDRVRGRPAGAAPVTKSGWVLLMLARLPPGPTAWYTWPVSPPATRLPRRFRVPPLRATRALLRELAVLVPLNTSALARTTSR